MEKETMGTVISVIKQWWLKVNRNIINGSSIFRLALALFIVSITQDTSNVFDSVQAMIFLEYKSIILVK